MGLFDSIRRTLGGGDDTANEHSESGESATEPASDGPTVTDSAALSPAEFRQRAETVADRSADLDFSTASLSRLDAAVADQFDDEPVAASEDTAYTTHTVRFGSYLGEVLVRELDGRWVQDDGWGVTVAGADDERTVAVFDVAARSFADEPVFAAVLDRLETELSVPADSDGPAGAGDPADEPEPSGPATSESPQGDDTDSTVTSWEDAGGWQPATETPGFDGSDADADEGSDADADEGGVADTPDDADPVDDDAFHIPDAEGGVAATAGTTPPADADTDTDDGNQTGTDAWSLAAASDPEAGGDPTESLLDRMDRKGDPASDPAAGDGLRADHAERAAEFAEFWSERDLDFTPESLTRLDDLVDAEWEDDRFADATYGGTDSFDDRAFTSLVEELGSYFGEVVVRDLDGEWTDETDHDAVVVTGADGRLAVPVSEVAIGAVRDDGAFDRSYRALLADLEA
ncbi:hypothetical protein [Haloarcula pelagica]|uniref:hypothetical protein n=1 Tax=Haloarcula pelagica TaxID=3033389 RepID=UPI0024C2865F|nr:hypothetical protein [Halomicroarcula sp. YJ-61-S]